MNDKLPVTLAITGASGFLGRHLVTECAIRGFFKLRLLTRNKNVCHFPSSEMIKLCEGDLLKPESLKDFLQPNCILIHLAYLNNAGAAVNIEAISNLMQAIKEAGVKRVVHCSTAVVVGFGAEGIVTENTTPRPKGEYQRTKYQIETILRLELPQTIELAILRPTHIIGPGGQALKSMITRLQCANRYKKAIYHCILKSRRFNYVSVHNVVAALILLATTSNKHAGDVYNISDDDDIDNNYAAVEKIINAALGHRNKYYLDIGLPLFFLSFLFKLLLSHSPINRVYSNSKISSLLGYKKEVTLAQAISEIVLLEQNNAGT